MVGFEEGRILMHYQPHRKKFDFDFVSAFRVGDEFRIKEGKTIYSRVNDALRETLDQSQSNIFIMKH